jgi:thiamine pyrophosphate-dependent acetolactate synthase large subunit-like protein
LRRHQDELRFVQTRHQDMAAFMACGHAKFTGEVGVCTATSGPGAIHLLNGLYDAKLDHQPVVAIVGQTFVRAIGADFQQEVKLLQLYSDVPSAFCEQANEPSTIRHLIDRALRIAQAERTVTCVIVTADVQDMEAVPEQPHKTHTVRSGVGYWRPRLIPQQSQLQRAADILNEGERVAMLVGQGALHATDEVIAVADALGAGVAKALLGKAAVPDDVPQGLFSALSRQLPDNAILSSDSGSAANWYARQIRIRRGMKAMRSGNLATMLPGVPYAIAAKFAFGDRVSIAMVGDGAMQMGGMAEMLTAAKYYKTWADPRMVVLVLVNEDLNQVTWEQRVMEGDPEFKAFQEIPYVDYAAWAELIGLKGIKITKAAEIEDAWRPALSADRPAIISALTDPNEAPLPPHITFQQAEGFANSIKADPEGGIPGAVESVREKARELLSGR